MPGDWTDAPPGSTIERLAPFALGQLGRRARLDDGVDQKLEYAKSWRRPKAGVCEVALPCRRLLWGPNPSTSAWCHYVSSSVRGCAIPRCHDSTKVAMARTTDALRCGWLVGERGGTVLGTQHRRE